MAFLLPAIGTMSTLSTAVSVASTLFGAIGQYNQYQAQSKANAYNAAIARQRSEQALSVVNQREESQRRFSRLRAGERIAAIGQSGTGTGGSNADVERQSEIMAELDALNIRYEGQVESTGLLNQASLEDYYSKANKSNARSALIKGAFGATGQLLTSGIFDKKGPAGTLTIGGGGGYY